MTTASTVTTALGPSWLDSTNLIESFGGFALAGIALVIFAECGLLLGFFLPGDSLLFTAGLLISTGVLHQQLWFTCLVLTLASIAGNVTGYWIGHVAGPAIFSRPDARLFKVEHVDRTRAFFDKYGAPAIVLARFVPVVRTFITVMAGVAKMRFRDYLAYSTLGGLIWASGVTIIGHALGGIDWVRVHIDSILSGIEVLLLGIVVVSVGVPLMIEFRRRRRAGRAAESGETDRPTADVATDDPLR